MRKQYGVEWRLVSATRDAKCTNFFSYTREGEEALRNIGEKDHEKWIMAQSDLVR